MKAKKVIALLLVTIMALSMAACSGSTTTTTNTPSTPSGSTETSSTPAPASQGSSGGQSTPAPSENVTEQIVVENVEEGISMTTAPWYRGEMNVYTSAVKGQFADKDPNTLTVGSGNQIIGCDPLNSQDEYPWSYNLYEPLIFRNWTTNEREPGLATAWEYDDEGNLHVTLREGVKFHDGTMLDAEDVFFTYKRNADESSSQVHDACAAIDFEKSYAEDDLHLVFVFKYPAASFLDAMMTSFLGIMSKDFVDAHGADYDYFEADAGSGPYMVKETNSGLDQTFERFDDYWGEAPAYQYVKCVLYKDFTVGVIDYINGDLDIVQSINNYDAAMRFFNGEVESTICYQLPINRGYIVYMNTSTGACADENVRLAVAHAIDWEDVVFGVYQGNELGRRAQCITLDGTKYAITDGGYDYDPDLARQYLAAAGYDDKNVLHLTIETSDNAVSQAACEQIQYWLSEIGIDLECIFEKSAAMTKASNDTGYTFDMCFYPMQYRSGHPSELLSGRDAWGKEIGNYSQLKGIQDEHLHDLMVAGAKELDETKASEIYTEIQYMFKDHAWTLPAMTATSVIFCRDYVAGTTFSNGYGNVWCFSHPAA